MMGERLETVLAAEALRPRVERIDDERVAGHEFPRLEASLDRRGEQSRTDALARVEFRDGETAEPVARHGVAG